MSAQPIRWGMTVPFDDQPLGQQRDRFVELADLGYTDVWSAEANGHDAFTPLALASVWAPSLRLGTAIVPAYTRGRATLAQCVGSIAQAAPGRFALGIGSSSNVIVERWNDIPFDDPYAKVRDTLRYLRVALTGEKAEGGFRLGAVPPEPVPILVAALRSGMLRLAGREGDGAIINWLSADDVATVAPIVRDAAAEAGRPEPEICARIFVAPTTDADTVRGMGRYAIAAYLSVPVYAEFHRWLGREDRLGEMWKLWAEGDRKGALAAIPDSVVDELIVWGHPDQCHETLQRYIANGVTTLSLAPLPFGYAVRDAVRALAPR
jgi:probable F420-dependent oxidoreductase